MNARDTGGPLMVPVHVIAERIAGVDWLEVGPELDDQGAVVIDCPT